MSRNFDREVYGGWFDGGYAVSRNKRVNGKLITLWACPVFTLWASMLYRVNVAPKTNPKKYEIYADTIVCDEWLLFSSFKRWRDNHFVEGWFLDKDLSNPFLSEYSPKTCMFVPAQVNVLFTGTGKDGLIGVYYNKERGLYQAQCKGSGSDNKYLGRFATAEEGHRAWLAAKLLSLEGSKVEHHPEINNMLTKWQGVLKYALDHNKGILNMKGFVRDNPESWEYWRKPHNFVSVTLNEFLPKENKQ